MTKKIFAMFLAVLMVVSMLPTSVFAATCPGAGNHTAKNCDNTVLGVTEPTCKVPGFTAYKCNVCEEEFHDNVVPATGEHTYVAAPDKAPTCEEEGKQGRMVCSGCGDEKAATTIPSLSNGKYNCQWEITNPQINCLTGGEQIWKCVNCGAEKVVKIEKKAAHAWGEFKLVTPATATANGVAKRVCACGAEDEVVVYYSHDCKASLITVAAIPKTCTTDGLYEHKECRICGTKYNAAGTTKLNADQIANLTDKAGHVYDCPTGCQLTASHKEGKAHKATCVDTILHCSVCDQTVAANVAHEYNSDKSKWTVGAEATCTKSGYITDTCKNCGIAVATEIVAALGHRNVTVEIPATCQTIAYTFTYCARANCKDCMGIVGTITDKNSATYSVQVEGYKAIEAIPAFAAAEERETKGFYLALTQGKTGVDLYFTGKMDDKYLDVSENVAEATLVYLERVHAGVNNAYYLFFYDAENVKTYIDMEGYMKWSGNKQVPAASVKLTTEKPAAVFGWNAQYGILTAEVVCSETQKDTFFLGTYNNFETISASSSFYLGGNGQFYAKLAEGEMKNVQLTGYTFDYNGGVNASNHAHNLTTNVLIPAECEKAGVGEYRCAACGWSQRFEIPAGHDFKAQKTGKVNNEDAYKAPTCVPGYVYEVCACGEFQKIVLPGYGHVMGAEQSPALDHEHTSGYKHTDCTISGCTYSIKGEYMTWEGLNKVYATWTEAATAHGNKLPASGTVTVAGNCTTAKRTQYKCACGMWVIVEETGYGYGMHKDMLTLGQYKAPTCTDDGGFYTFYCSGCKAYIGNAPYSETPGDANWNVEKATGHNFVVARGHECEDCDSPDYTDVHSSCACGETVKCFTRIASETITTGMDLCDTSILEYYWCEKCQDEHMRSFVVAMGHEWAPVVNNKGEIVYTTAPTCTAAGEYTLKCSICDETKSAVAAPVAHENKAGEKFFEKCTDTVTDRHCVKCCQCAGKGATHDCVNNKVNGQPAPCDCVISTDHQYESVKMPSTCSMPPYLAKSCPDCGHRTNEVMTEINGEKVVFIGHKPAAIDMIPEVNADGKLTGNMVEVKYPGFTYETFTFVSYIVNANGEWEKVTETYTAKFIERKAASYTEAGYDHFVCQICQTEEKNEIAKLSGLGFELDVKNALGVEGFTYGSLIEVTVSANGNNAAVHGFNFMVDVLANVVPVVDNAVLSGAKFVGYEKLNESFNLVVTNPENTSYGAMIAGFAANDAAGKQQNITINGKTELVKLFFRVTETAAAAQYTASFQPTSVTKLDNGTAVDIRANTNFVTKNFNVRGHLDFNNDGIANTTDLYLAMSMITLENEKTYDVTVDVNKDGVVDLQDLSIAYNYFVGNYDRQELLVMGISDEEVKLLDLNEKTFCNSSACGKEIDANATFCPFCGNHQ